jgi:hypothetical protein
MQQALENVREALLWHYRQGHSNTLGGARLKIDEKALRDASAALAEPEPAAAVDAAMNKERGDDN